MKALHFYFHLIQYFESVQKNLQPDHLLNKVTGKLEYLRDS